MSERATVTCFCGQTGLTFANPLPRNHSECLCVDCRQKLEWACGQAGRPWTPTISNLWYIDDDVVATKGDGSVDRSSLDDKIGLIIDPIRAATALWNAGIFPTSLAAHRAVDAAAARNWPFGRREREVTQLPPAYVPPGRV